MTSQNDLQSKISLMNKSSKVFITVAIEGVPAFFVESAIPPQIRDLISARFEQEKRSDGCPPTFAAIACDALPFVLAGLIESKATPAESPAVRDGSPTPSSKSSG